MSQPEKATQASTYEIFVGMLSILSIFNVVLYYAIPSSDVSTVIHIMDTLLTVIFFSDFIFRLATAESKSHYFFREYGWADLLGSLPVPQLKLLRLFRVVRVLRMIRDFGLSGFFIEFVHNRARSALLTLLLFVILLLEFGGMSILSVEHRAPDALIQTGGDAIWYTFVTITTVGYGDLYPVTQQGRLIGMLIMAVGVALFGTLTGFLSSVFLGEPAEPDPLASAETSTPSNLANANNTPSARDVAITSGDAEAKLAEVKRMLADVRETQSALASKIDDIESLL